MGKVLTIEDYRYRFYEKYPDRTWLKFLKKDKNHLIVEDKFGICRVARSHLMRGWMPSIRVAIDKNAYFTKRLKSIHGDLYDCSFIEYKGLDIPIKLICPVHGEFYITPHAITSQKSGCNRCGYLKSSVKNGLNATGWSDSDWYEKAKNSIHFDSFKVYIIECWDENERFFKIGKTFRTMKERFTKHKERMPYNYSIIKIYELKELILESAKEISKMERLLKEQNKENKYVPLEQIRGRFECFKQINI